MTIRFTPLTGWVLWCLVLGRTETERKCLEIFHARWAFQILCISVWGRE